MRVARRPVEPSQDTWRRRLHADGVARWLVPGCYLVGAVLLTWRLWVDPASRAQLLGNGVSADIRLFSWFLRYDATAVAHGHLPALVTTAVNAPEGINLMWNTALLLPGIVLAPVTLLAGPMVTLTVLLTLGFAGSATALFLVLRRWECGTGFAALGGAVYGFSPALVDTGVGHYHLQFAVLPPLIIDALLRIVTGRGRTVRTGIWLGLLAAVQIFIGEELLVDTAIAGVLLVVVLAASRPRSVPSRAGPAAAGLGTAVVAALVVSGYSLWVQFRGRLTEHGSPWSTAHFRNHPADFVVPPGGMLFHSQATAAALAARPPRLAEYLAYLGWPLLVVLVICAVWFWRDIRVRAAAVTWAVLEVFSLGTHNALFGRFRYPAAWLPWSGLQHLPVLSQLLVDRLSILADGAAAAVLAFSLDRAWTAMPHAPAWRRGLPAAVAVLAVLPIVPLPLRAGDITPVPAGWQTAFARLRLAPGARVLMLPANSEAMGWQAATGQPISLIGGYCIAPTPSGQARGCATAKTATGKYLAALQAGAAQAKAPTRARIAADFGYWRPAAVVAVTRRGSRLAGFLTRILGPPAVEAGRVLGWHVRHGPLRLQH
ncbi:MAG TPA: hypothetical protein VGM53_34655 [Streptosporangiaceae bacterium]|jgi:hypothetical protein